MNPTCIFKPFGPTGPKIVLGGISTGDWRTSNLRENPQSNPGLYRRLSDLGRYFGFSKLLAPLIGDCDAKVCDISELPTIIQGTVWCFVMAVPELLLALIVQQQSFVV